MKKPSTEIDKTMRPATGEVAATRDAHDAEARARAAGITPKVVPGHGQGGSGH